MIQKTDVNIVVNKANINSENSSSSMKGSISPTMDAARNLGLVKLPKVKKLHSNALDPNLIKEVVIKIKEVSKSLNSSTKILCQTRFESGCDHTGSFNKILDDIISRSKSLLTKIEKSRDESQKILKSKVSKPIKK